MRQAGRYLPEYRKLKAASSFLEMVRTPALAAEVTLQPLARFPLDAAIFFSDILVVPEAMGQPYGFRDQGGIEMAFALRDRADVAALTTHRVEQKLEYVAEGLRETGLRLEGKAALLGFAGSPWTLACYMLEGGSAAPFPTAQSWFRERPDDFNSLMEKLTEAVTRYLLMQRAAGADAVQIFDSWAAVCPEADYEGMSLRWIRRIISALPEDFPVILYAKGVGQRVRDLMSVHPRALSCDWTVSLPGIASSTHAPKCLQGNLDPSLLCGPPEAVREQTHQLLESMRAFPGYIFNLGHGITPDARLDSVEAMVQTVLDFS